MRHYLSADTENPERATVAFPRVAQRRSASPQRDGLGIKILDQSIPIAIEHRNGKCFEEESDTLVPRLALSSRQVETFIRNRGNDGCHHRHVINVHEGFL